MQAFATSLILTAVAGTLAFSAPINISADIDSTRISGSNPMGTITTQPGFTSWDTTNVGSRTIPDPSSLALSALACIALSVRRALGTIKRREKRRQWLIEAQQQLWL
jgi:hypothetical protein